MADMTPLTDILNDDPATATPVQNNFQTIETYINGTDLVRTDGTEVMTADLDLDGNKVVNLAEGTVAGDAVEFGQFDDLANQKDYATKGTSTTITGSATTVATLTVEAPSAGLGAIHMYSSVTTSGGAYGFATDTIYVTYTGATGLPPDDAGLGEVATFASNTTQVVSTVLYVLLASGTNTINVRLSANITSGATVTMAADCRFGIVGMF